MDNVYVNETQTVLVLDDDADQLNLIRNYLTRRDMEVHESNNGFAIVEKMHTHKPDLILMDALMPGVDGFHACEELRRHSEARDIPIIMMTSLDDPDIINWAFECGADDFIRKPLSMTLLYNRIMSHMEVKRTSSLLTHAQMQLETKIIQKDQELMRQKMMTRQEILDHKRTKQKMKSMWQSHTMMPQAV